MVNQNKIFSFKIKRQAKNFFPRDVERTVGVIHCVCSRYCSNTHESLYEMVHYSTVSDIRRLKDGSRQKCLDYIDHLWSFFYIIFTFLFGYNTVIFLYILYCFVSVQHDGLANTVFSLDPSKV